MRSDITPTGTVHQSRSSRACRRLSGRRKLSAVLAASSSLLLAAIGVGEVPVNAQQASIGIGLSTPIEGNLQSPQRPESQRDAQATLNADARLAKLFGDVNQINSLPEARRMDASSPAADAVFSAEATGRRTSDIGQLVQRSKAAHGVAIQHRTPIVSDTRVRGQRVGQVLASGSYWAPARMDLDTMMSKIDSRLIDNLILIKGPYAAKYGPGFRFVDFDFVHSPRYQQGRHLQGTTSATYQTNGEQWYGRTSLQGGGDRHGFFVSYGHSTANDYETGESGFFMPSSFKSRDIFIAYGWDLSPTQSIEINALRLDQTDVEFPGLVYDLNFLVTDGYEVTYTDTAPGFADKFTAEFWYNRTRFEGDTLRASKNRQIPELQLSLESSSGFDGYAVTDGDGLSGGYRMESTFLTGNGQVSVGTDLILLNQQLNDIEPEAPLFDNNFPVPRSHSVDVGIYVEDIEQIDSCWTMTAGARVDGVFTDSDDIVDGVPIPLSDLKDADLDQEFLLGSAYLTSDYRFAPGWSINSGIGTAHRNPTLTELYVESSFIGSLQRGLTFLQGDPELESEKILQVDAGLQYEDDQTQFGVQTYYSWIHDYITYDLIDPAGTIDGFQQGAYFVNTDLATIAGAECFGQYAARNWLTLFGVVSYTEGRDLSRNEPARNSFFPDRSDLAGVDHEPLPGIHPLEGRMGVVIQDPSPQQRWGLEFMTRVVDNQDRVAESLDEVETPGFTTYDLRGYRRIGSCLLTGGVENFTDKFYREHIDYRSGLGVFRPGIGAYVGAEWRY